MDSTCQMWGVASSSVVWRMCRAADFSHPNKKKKAAARPVASEKWWCIWCRRDVSSSSSPSCAVLKLVFQSASELGAPLPHLHCDWWREPLNSGEPQCLNSNSCHNQIKDEAKTSFDLLCAVLCSSLEFEKAIQILEVIQSFFFCSLFSASISSCRRQFLPFAAVRTLIGYSIQTCRHTV